MSVAQRAANLALLVCAMGGWPLLQLVKRGGGTPLRLEIITHLVIEPWKARWRAELAVMPLQVHSSSGMIVR